MLEMVPSPKPESNQVANSVLIVVIVFVDYQIPKNSKISQSPLAQIKFINLYFNKFFSLKKILLLSLNLFVKRLTLLKLENK